MNLENTCTLHGPGFTCSPCSIKVGDEVLVEGMETPGVVKGRSGRMLRVEVNGKVVVKDQAKVHKA